MIAPIAPPPIFFCPSSYDSFNTFANSPFTSIFPIDIWYIHIITAILIRKIPYCISFGDNACLFSHAKFIAMANVPIGTMYFIHPIIPPRNGLKVFPIYPEFVYINTASSILIIIIETTAKSISVPFCFFLVFVFLVVVCLFLFFVAILFFPFF